ncbi:MAG: universal stress protein [Deltaproteobacteria bacterium]|nr:universal stress protein [Deltaproteobacteria bacterium]
MSRPAPAFDVRRIVVAIDGSPEARDVLEAAARLAARLHAELEGVFVRDINLVHLARLPVGREIQFLTGQGRDFTAEALEADIRTREFTARRALAAAAERVHVQYSFRTAQGQVDVEYVTAADAGDLLIVGSGSRSPWGTARFTHTAREVAERAPRSVLVSRPGAWFAAGVPLVCHDGGTGSWRALDAGLYFFGVHEGRLAVLILANDRGEAETLRAQVEAHLAARGVSPRFLYGVRPRAPEVCRLAGEAGAGVLVMAADCPALDAPRRREVLESIACPVLIVR